MITGSFPMLSVVLMTLLALAAPVALVWLLVKVLQGLSWAIRGVFRTIGRGTGHVSRLLRGEIVDTLHLAGGIVTAGVITPLALANLCIGRFSAAAYYGRALEDELTNAALCVYRIGIGHPVRFLGLGAVTEGLERRIPDLVSRAPRRQSGDPKKRQFEGYEMLGTLAAGGSGARLYLARPRDAKLRHLRARGHADPGQVVIKSFDLGDGSTLPQIVRESRALEAAGRLGLVLEHELTEKSFHYVMPFVPGDDLDTVTRRLHARSGTNGLGKRELAKVLGYGSDLMQTLERFHRGGLWHKDIKPSNLIVSSDRVHVVDLGLVTPLQSAMTLTTHGTEYFRDPELVRLAMKGVKVHDVDGAKFDIYSAGAVLYSMVEDSFPAHGSLSRISKPCPEALQWIIRRSMADLATRYGSARAMWGDLQTLMAAKDPWAVLPAELPSVGGGDVPELDFDAGLAAGDEPMLAGSPAPGTLRGGRVPDTDLRARRAVRRRVLGAAGIVGMASLIASGMVLFAREAQRLHASETRGGRWDDRRPGSDFEEAVRRHAGTRSRMAAATAGANRAHPSLSAEPILAQLPVLDAAATPKRVLVLSGLRLSSPDSRSVEVCTRMLQRRGYEVLSGDRNDEDEVIDLKAGALSAVGLGNPRDADARGRLQRYLDSTENLYALVWVMPGSPGQPSGRAITLLRATFATPPGGQASAAAETVDAAYEAAAAYSRD